MREMVTQRATLPPIPEPPHLDVERIPSLAVERITCFSSVQFSSVAQSCPTLCDPMDGSPQGSSVPEILQAGILEGVAISFSNACMHAKSLQACLTL